MCCEIRGVIDEVRGVIGEARWEEPSGRDAVLKLLREMAAK